MADVDTAPATDSASKKARLVDNFYIDSEGNKASRPQPDVVAVSKVFKQSGYVETIRLSDLSPESLNQAAAFGLQQVGQNAYGAAGDEGERIEMLQERWGTILEGRWSSERATGVRSNDVVEAYLAAKAERSGQPTTDEDRARVKASLGDDAAAIKALLENPLVAAKHAAIKAQRAAERATAAAGAVKAEDELPDL
jgi:hypothetical protein